MGPHNGDWDVILPRCTNSSCSKTVALGEHLQPKIQHSTQTLANLSTSEPKIQHPTQTLTYPSAGKKGTCCSAMSFCGGQPRQEEKCHAAEGLKGQRYYYTAPQDVMTFDEWKSSYVQPDTYATNKTPVDQPCSPAAVAIMISGQLQRFVYKDQTGVLLAPAKCPAVADVYIALSNASSVTMPYQLWIHDQFPDQCQL